MFSLGILKNNFKKIFTFAEISGVVYVSDVEPNSKWTFVLYFMLIFSSLSNNSSLVLGKVKLKEWGCNGAAWNIVRYAVYNIINIVIL